MEGTKNQPRALLVFGAPCSGKTTFGRKFAKRFNLAFYDLDELQSKYHLSRKIILVFIEQIAKTGQTVLIEGCLDTEKDRKEVCNILRAAGYAPSTIWIQTDIATIRARLKARYKVVSEAKNAYEAAVSRLEAPSDEEMPIILSGKHTFDTQVKHVLAGLA